MIIGIDFDGTCVTHDFPAVGKDIGAAEVLHRLVDKSHKLILFTMRSHRKEGKADKGTLGYDNNSDIKLESDVLDDAINWFRNHSIPLYGVNENPSQSNWTDSPKPYCHLYINDASLGIPLTFNPGLSNRPFVNWHDVKQILTEMKAI